MIRNVQFYEDYDFFVIKPFKWDLLHLTMSTYLSCLHITPTFTADQTFEGVSFYLWAPLGFYLLHFRVQSQEHPA